MADVLKEEEEEGGITDLGLVPSSLRADCTGGRRSDWQKRVNGLRKAEMSKEVGGDGAGKELLTRRCQERWRGELDRAKKWEVNYYLN